MLLLLHAMGPRRKATPARALLSRDSATMAARNAGPARDRPDRMEATVSAKRSGDVVDHCVAAGLASFCARENRVSMGAAAGWTGLLGCPMVRPWWPRSG